MVLVDQGKVYTKIPMSLTVFCSVPLLRPGDPQYDSICLIGQYTQMHKKGTVCYWLNNYVS